MVVQPDGKIVMAAKNGPGSNFEGNFALIRYTSNGTLDSSFGNGGITITSAYIPISHDITLTNDQSILIAGRGGAEFGGGIFLTLRHYNRAGAIDSSFAMNGL